MSLEPKPKYSPEVIRRYREMRDSKSFEREIVKRKPISLEEDRLTLSCGHSTVLPYRALALLVGTGQLGEKAARKKPSVLCEGCKLAWLAKQAQPAAGARTARARKRR